MSKTKRSALVFLIDQMEFAESLLSAEELGLMYIALRKYALEGERPQIDGKSKLWCVTFDFMARAQDDYLKRYERTCERNRANANRRWQKRESSSDALASAFFHPMHQMPIK